MKNIKTFLPLLFTSTSLLLAGCSSGGSENRTPALFNTKAEAEKAAKDFNCTGAHQMGDKWMPCKSHKDHQENQTEDSHAHHSH